MRVDIQARRFILPDGLRHAVHGEITRLTQALGAGITRVSVRLFDVNGVRGGPDKGCLVHAQFTDRTSIVGSDVRPDVLNRLSTLRPLVTGAHDRHDPSARRS